MFFSIFPVEFAAKAAGASPVSISGFQELYVLSAEQIGKDSVMVTAVSDKKDDPKHIRVVVNNGSITNSIDLNMKSSEAEYLGAYENFLGFLDKKNLVMQILDIKSGEIVEQLKLPAESGILPYDYITASIDNSGSMWVINSNYDNPEKAFILRLGNKAGMIPLNSIEGFNGGYMLGVSSFFEFYQKDGMGLASIDANNKVKVYDVGKEYNTLVDSDSNIWRYKDNLVEKLALDNKEQLVSKEKYEIQAGLGDYYGMFDKHNNLWLRFFEKPVLLKLAEGKITKYEVNSASNIFGLSFDKNNNLWLNFSEEGKIYELVDGSFALKYNYDASKTIGGTALNIYDEKNFVLWDVSTYLSYTEEVPATPDELYSRAYKAALAGVNGKTQKQINVARKAIKALEGTDASWAIGEFSKQIDQVQNVFLVNICDAISKAEANGSQANINAAKAIIDPELPAEWKNAYSSAVDVVQQKLMKKLEDAVNKAVANKLIADTDAAKALIAEVKTATDTAIVSWAEAMEKLLISK
jgi:hypothetical protein